MKIPHPITLICLGLAFMSPLHAEFRSWTNTEGVVVEAELVKTEGEKVTLRLRSGKLATFAQAKLSTADQDFIKNSKVSPAAATTPEVKPVVEANRKARWLTKMDKAQEQSKQTGLPILVLFTGTSWCGYCVELESAVFSKSEFKSFADKNLVLLKLEYGPGGTAGNKKDKLLAEEFRPDGFPSYFLTDSGGKKYASGGYNDEIDPASFAEWVKSAKRPE